MAEAEAETTAHHRDPWACSPWLSQFAFFSSPGQCAELPTLSLIKTMPRRHTYRWVSLIQVLQRLTSHLLR